MKLSDKKNGYVLHEIVKGKKYALCKILNEYDSEESALGDLVNILSRNIDEKSLLDKYKNKIVI